MLGDFKLNQVIFIGLRSSKCYYRRPGGGAGIWEGSFRCEFLRGSMCAEGMGCGRRWVSWVLRGTGTASGHPGVPWKISPRMRWLSQSAICSKIGQPEWWRWIGDGAYSIAVGGTWMHGRVALGGLDKRRWTPWIPWFTWRKGVCDIIWCISNG